MRRYLGTALALMVVVTLAFSVGRTVQRTEIPPPVTLLEVAGERTPTGTAGPRERADRTKRADAAAKRAERRRAADRDGASTAPHDEHPAGGPAADAEDD